MLILTVDWLGSVVERAPLKEPGGYSRCTSSKWPLLAGLQSRLAIFNICNFYLVVMRQYYLIQQNVAKCAVYNNVQSDVPIMAATRFTPNTNMVQAIELSPV